MNRNFRNNLNSYQHHHHSTITTPYSKHFNMHSTFTSFTLSFYSAGPSDNTTHSSRRSSFTCGGDEVVFNNTGPVPGPIERPKMAPKVKVDKVGLGLGLPTGDLHISFRDDSKVCSFAFSQYMRSADRILSSSLLLLLSNSLLKQNFDHSELAHCAD